MLSEYGSQPDIQLALFAERLVFSVSVLFYCGSEKIQKKLST